MYSPMDTSPSSSSSSSSSSIHHASLVDSSNHSPALLEMVDLQITRSVIEYTVDLTVEAVDYAMGRPSTSTRGRPAAKNSTQAKFTTFVTNVLTRAEVNTPTLIATLAYINRARPHLHIALEEWALERVFLGALIVASKYLNDSTLKNMHWAMCTGVFGKRDVGRIEREFLDVLDWELALAEDDLLSHHDGLMSAVTAPRRHHRSHQHPAFASEPSHRHFASTTSPAAKRISIPELTSSPHSSSSSSASSSSTIDSPRTPSSPSPIVPKPSTTHGKTSSSSSTMELLRSFPIPVPSLPRYHGQPIRLSA